MVVYTVTYAFTNPTSGFNSTNYSTGTVYLNNIKSNNLHVKSNIILSDSITSWTFPSMLGSQNTITLATSMTVSNGSFYNILSYTFPQIGVYNIQAQFCFILNSNTVNTFCLASLSTTSVTVDMFFQSTHLLPPMPGHNLGLWSSKTRGFEKITDHSEKKTNFRDTRSGSRNLFFFEL